MSLFLYSHSWEVLEDAFHAGTVKHESLAGSRTMGVGLNLHVTHAALSLQILPQASIGVQCRLGVRDSKFTMSRVNGRMNSKLAHVPKALHGSCTSAHASPNLKND